MFVIFLLLQVVSMEETITVTQSPVSIQEVSSTVEIKQAIIQPECSSEVKQVTQLEEQKPVETNFVSKYGFGRKVRPQLPYERIRKVKEEYQEQINKLKEENNKLKQKNNNLSEIIEGELVKFKDGEKKWKAKREEKLEIRIKKKEAELEAKAKAEQEARVKNKVDIGCSPIRRDTTDQYTETEVETKYEEGKANTNLLFINDDMNDNYFSKDINEFPEDINKDNDADDLDDCDVKLHFIPTTESLYIESTYKGRIYDSVQDFLFKVQKNGYKKQI